MIKITKLSKTLHLTLCLCLIQLIACDLWIIWQVKPKLEIKRGEYKVKTKLQSFINCSTNNEILYLDVYTFFKAWMPLCKYACVSGAFRDASSLGGNLNQRDKSSRETIFLYHKI